MATLRRICYLMWKQQFNKTISRSSYSLFLSFQPWSSSADWDWCVAPSADEDHVIQSKAPELVNKGTWSRDCFVNQMIVLFGSRLSFCCLLFICCLFFSASVSVCVGLCGGAGWYVSFQNHSRCSWSEVNQVKTFYCQLTKETDFNAIF